MKTLAVYHKTVPNAKNREKIDLLVNFAAGAKNSGDAVYDLYDYQTRPVDVAVIQGWVNIGSKTGLHLDLRNRVVSEQLARSKHVVVVDSNLFLYADTTNSLHYLRYSFNGVFPNTGIYCDSEIDPRRWVKLSSNLGLKLKNWRTSGNHILLCLQRNGGWSMGDFDVQDWTIKTINQLRQHTDRPIVIRAHPGDKSSQQYLDPRNPKCKLKYSKDIRLSTNKSLVDDLRNCWAAVNYNSSPVVGAAIEGVPIFVTDPSKSQCSEVASLDLAMIEKPSMPDRQPWVERLSMFHWNFEELRSGECWQHMRKFAVGP